MVELKQNEKEINETVRSWPQPIRHVPKSSIIGSILFILFTKNLLKYLREFNTTIWNAGDSVLLISERLEIRSRIALNMAT